MKLGGIPLTCLAGIRNDKRLRRESRRKGQRRAAVLICVLVVLLIAGALSIQATQSLAIIRRGEERRSRLYQARELLELGKAAVEQQQIQKEVTWTIELDSGRGKIQVIPYPRPEATDYRILATFPADSDHALQVTWDSSGPLGRQR